MDSRENSFWRGEIVNKKDFEALSTKDVYLLAQREDLASRNPLKIRKNLELSKGFISRAKELVLDSSSKLKTSKNKAEKNLCRLQKLRLTIWEKEMGEFARLFSEIKNLELINELKTSSNMQIPNVKEIGEIQEYSVSAKETLAGGITSLTAGGVAALVAWNGAMAVGAASTGTAIAGLSGAAATNATLAWFGGGALAAGGGGMAAGAIVLGITGFLPAIAVASGLASFFSIRKLSKTRKEFIESYDFFEQCKIAVVVTDGIDEITIQMLKHTQQFRLKMKENLEQLGHMISYCGTDYKDFCEKSQMRTLESIRYAETMKRLVLIPLLMEDGSLNEKAHVELGLIKDFIKKCDG